MIKAVTRASSRSNRTVKSLQDKSEKEADRLFNIVTLRNYQYHHIVPEVIKFIEDNTQPEKLRVAAIEALGWFNRSYQAGKIAESCKRVMASDAPQAVKNEAQKTFERLQ